MTTITAYKKIGFPVTLTQIVDDDSGVLEVVSEGKFLGYITVLEIEEIIRGQ